jgi:hypothetical protein
VRETLTETETPTFVGVKQSIVNTSWPPQDKVFIWPPFFEFRDRGVSNRVTNAGKRNTILGAANL